MSGGIQYEFRVIGVKDNLRHCVVADCSYRVAKATARACDGTPTWDTAHVESRTVTQWKKII